MRPHAAAFLVSTLSLCDLSGCVLAAYDWDSAPPSTHDAAGIDASGIDAPPPDVPAALQGTIHYPMAGGGSGPPVTVSGTLRINVYPLVTDTDAMGPDVTGFDTVTPDAASANANNDDCVGMSIGPAAYSLSIYPAPDPASFRFDDVPIGHYCVSVVLDLPPFYSPGDTPGCEDPRATAPDVTVVVPLTTAPDLFLRPPSACR